MTAGRPGGLCETPPRTVAARPSRRGRRSADRAKYRRAARRGRRAPVTAHFPRCRRSRAECRRSQTHTLRPGRQAGSPPAPEALARTGSPCRSFRSGACRKGSPPDQSQAVSYRAMRRRVLCRSLPGARRSPAARVVTKASGTTARPDYPSPWEDPTSEGLQVLVRAAAARRRSPPTASGQQRTGRDDSLSGASLVGLGVEIPDRGVAVLIGVRIAREHVGRNVPRKVPEPAAAGEGKVHGRQVARVVAVAWADHDRNQVAAAARRHP